MTAKCRASMTSYKIWSLEHASGPLTACCWYNTDNWWRMNITNVQQELENLQECGSFNQIQKLQRTDHHVPPGDKLFVLKIKHFVIDALLLLVLCWNYLW